ncbi:response regulator transcription factor [Klebsiella sp. BIGb0407]|uniref:response regulator n=1 Tax=Klebsiella sp. BIGb0407 TaxID=2940603 RepID=UPI00216935BF|nr:response regulator transcription factor [Klebsiella sp. BIGb0407]MCS3432751.1 DNA-binding response OmpR family regulator [Klebsiella sp. BIGb0407]
MRVLIVEDEPEMIAALTKAFEKEGMIADSVSSIAMAKAVLQDDLHSLILLDRQLPDGDGASLVPFIRKMNADLPIIFLTGKSSIPDRIEGLDLGADDYLNKPFAFEELMARIRAIGRRPAKISIPKITIANLTFDFSNRDVQVDDIPLALPRRQLLVLEALCTRARRTVLREWLIERVYGFDEDVQSNSLDSHISRLRRSLEMSEARVTIHVIRGVGYLLKENNETA